MNKVPESRSLPAVWTLLPRSGGRKRASLRRDVTSLGAHSQASVCLASSAGRWCSPPCWAWCWACIDRHYPDQHFWTLTFMVAGLVLGCWNAWHWIVREQREIEREQKENGHE